MKWHVGIRHSESFLEVGATNGDTVLRDRFLLGRASVFDLVKRWVQLKLSESPESTENNVESYTLFSNWNHAVLERKLGHPVNGLLTAGFEHWPLVWHKEKYTAFLTQPKFELTDYVSKDWLLGLRERTNAQGEIKLPVKDEDLQFIASKLEMAPHKELFVGFLHSQRNPVNESKVCEFLRSTGIKTVGSSEVCPSNDERIRWLTAIAQTYAWTPCQEYIDKLKETDPTKIWKLFDPKGERSEWNVQNFLKMPWSPSTMRNVPSAKAQPILYCGLESWFLMDFREQCDTRQSAMGEIWNPQIKASALSIQPLSVIQLNEMSLPSPGPDTITFEPGPVILGRGLTLTFLDILWYLEMLGEVPGLSENISEKARLRVHETLLAMGRSAHQARFTESELAVFLVDQVVQTWLAEFEWNNIGPELTLTGPLAKPLHQILAKPLKKWNLKLNSTGHFSELDVILSGAGKC